LDCALENEGYANTAIGRGASLNVANGGNTALGYVALVNNVSGSDNVAVGSQALETNLSGSSLQLVNVQMYLLMEFPIR
jgi:hypothetical protein